MRIHRLFASIIAVTLGSAPVAMAMPGGGTQTDNGNTTEDHVEISGPFGEASQLYLDATSTNPVNGPHSGRVSLVWFAGTDFFWISCEGASVANAVSVHPATGISTIHLVLDPDNAECEVPSWSSNITAPVVVEAFGTPNGEYRSSDTCVNTSTFTTPEIGTSTARLNIQAARFSETFAVNWAAFSVSLGGTATAYRSTDRSQTK